MELQPVILSGGAGTRLWPLSRELYPKQLIPLLGKKSLLQLTIERLRGGSWLSAVQPALIIANQEHRFMIAEQCRQLNEPARIILEPCGRNTAPAATVAALAITKPAETLLLILPADHVVKNESAFRQAIATAIPLAEEGQVVMFGIVPDCPHTGYGYLKVDSNNGKPQPIAEFVEKPDAKRAEAFLKQGGYYWNSGMFLVRADVWLKAVETLQPAMLNAAKAALIKGKQDLDFTRLDEEAFSSSPSDSIDYAVMEHLSELGKATQGIMVPMDAGWSDLGAWPSIAEQFPSDEQQNVSKGDVMLEGSENCLAWSESRLLALVGVKDIIAVATPDAVLVAHKDQAQSVKHIVERLKAENRHEATLHRKVYRPWGSYEGVDEGERFQVKRICVNPGATLSLQKHFHRAEHWVVVTGTAEVTRNEEVFLVTENQSTFIPLGATHRLKNPGKVMLEMIEVQSGPYLGEDDIVRMDDVYGRQGQQ